MSADSDSGSDAAVAIPKREYAHGDAIVFRYAQPPHVDLTERRVGRITAIDDEGDIVVVTECHATTHPFGTPLEIPKSAIICHYG